MLFCLLSFLACVTKRLRWIYPVKDAEEFVLFCDLPELRKSQFSHINQLPPTQGPAYVPCSGNQNLSDVQWYKQPQRGGPLEEIHRNFSHERRDMLWLSAPQINNVGSFICRPRLRYVSKAFQSRNTLNSLLPKQVLTGPSLSPRRPQDTACCVKIVLELKPQRNVSCGNPAEHVQYLFLGSTGSIYCPSLSCQSDVQSPEMTWYLV